MREKEYTAPKFVIHQLALKPEKKEREKRRDKRLPQRGRTWYKHGERESGFEEDEADEEEEETGG